MSLVTFTVFVDHSQFFVEDDGLPYDDTWDLDATYSMVMKDHIGLKPGGPVIPTARSWGDVDVVVEVCETRPDVSFDGWDRVVECSILVSSGELTLLAPESGGSPDNPRVQISPGTYRVLVLSAGLNTVAGRPEPDGEDHYRLRAHGNRHHLRRVVVGRVGQR